MKKKILILISIILTISLLANKNQEIDMQNAPTENIYNFNVSSLQGDEIDFNQFKGKVLLIVNTASKCGFTRQYKDLESLQQRFINDDLIIIGIPSNDFGGQEPGNADEIATFCQKNYGVSFLMLEKMSAKGEKQHPIFKFLTQSNPDKSGSVSWNFNKFIINKNGQVTERFGSFTKPSSKKIISAINKELIQDTDT